MFEKCHAYFDDLNLVNNTTLQYIIGVSKKRINLHILTFQDNLPSRNFHTNTVLEMLVFKFNGGTVSATIDSNTTHVVIHSW